MLPGRARNSPGAARNAGWRIRCMAAVTWSRIRILKMTRQVIDSNKNMVFITRNNNYEKTLCIESTAAAGMGLMQGTPVLHSRSALRRPRQKKRPVVAASSLNPPTQVQLESLYDLRKLYETPDRAPFLAPLKDKMRTIATLASASTRSTSKQPGRARCWSLIPSADRGCVRPRRRLADRAGAKAGGG
jgi:hypothetical protein